MANDYRHDDDDYDDDDDDERIPKGICSVGIPCAHRDNNDLYIIGAVCLSQK